jgi:hypothetical protein
MERVDASGRWVSDDDGRSWSLVEPSAEYLAARAAAEVAEPPFAPLDALGRMATLSAILHDDVDDWANASGYPADHLIHEALAWGVAAGGG